MTTIHVFGDSHARFFFPAAFGYRRLGLDPVNLDFKGQAIPGASVVGFRPKHSSLGTKEKIRDQITDADFVVLAFGQVDLELGYYFRKVIKREAVEPEDYVPWLANIYRDYVDTLPTGSFKLAVKGVNISVLHPKDFAIRYVLRAIANEPERSGYQANRKALSEAMLSESVQNEMHLRFNAELMQIASERGHAYFDINSLIAAPNPVTAARDVALGVDLAFRPGQFDHHLADSLLVRKIHMTSAMEAFGLGAASADRGL